MKNADKDVIPSEQLPPSSWHSLLDGSKSAKSMQESQFKLGSNQRFVNRQQLAKKRYYKAAFSIPVAAVSYIELSAQALTGQSTRQLRELAALAHS